MSFYKINSAPEYHWFQELKRKFFISTNKIRLDNPNNNCITIKILYHTIFFKSNKTFYASYSLIVINTGFTKNNQVKINDKIYIKDPESSAFGKCIFESRIKMILDIGMEIFAFKKLAKEIDATESTIYQYLENKHKLLINNIS